MVIEGGELYHSCDLSGLEVLRSMRVFEAQHKPMTPMLWVLCAVVGIAPPLNNLSLRLNSVGFYTVAKLLVTPMIVSMEFLFERKVISSPRALSLVGVAVGVWIASVNDVHLTIAGFLTSMIWLPVAAIYKVRQRAHPG